MENKSSQSLKQWDTLDLCKVWNGYVNAPLMSFVITLTVAVWYTEDPSDLLFSFKWVEWHHLFRKSTRRLNFSLYVKVTLLIIMQQQLPTAGNLSSYIHPINSGRLGGTFKSRANVNVIYLKKCILTSSCYKPLQMIILAPKGHNDSIIFSFSFHTSFTCVKGGSSKMRYVWLLCQHMPMLYNFTRSVALRHR